MNSSRVTILGQRISLIRPSKTLVPKIYKDERPRPRYNKRPKTNEIGVAEFFRICLMHPCEFEEPKYWRR